MLSDDITPDTTRHTVGQPPENQPQRRRDSGAPAQHWQTWQNEGRQPAALASVDPVLAGVIADRGLLEILIGMAKQTAREYAQEHSTAPHTGWGSYVRNTAGWMFPSATGLAMTSNDVRATLRDMPLYRTDYTDADNSGPRPPPAPATIDFTRNVAARLIAEVDSLGTDDGLAHNEQLAQTKRAARQATEELLKALSLSAHDKSQMERATMALCMAPTLAMYTVSLAYSVYTEPPSWLYMGTQARGLAQTLPTIGGILADPAPSQRMVGIVNRERGVLWGAASLQYCVAAFMLGYALSHPMDQPARQSANKALSAEDTIGFVAGMAIANLLIYASVNHWEDLGRAASVKPTTIPAPTIDANSTPAERNLAGKLQNIQHLAILASKLTTVLDDVAAEMAPGGSQKMHHTEVKKAADHLVNTIDRACGGVKANVQLLDAEQKRLKVWAAASVIPLTAVLGAASTASSWQVEALRSQYPVTYGANIANLLLKAFKKSVDAEEMHRLFASYSGSTLPNLPIVISNLVTQAKYKETLWGIYTTNQKAHPTFDLTKYPWLHVADGKFNFAFLILWSACATMAWGSKGGQFFAHVLQRLAEGRKALNLPQMPAIPENQTRQIQNLFGNLVRSEGLSVDDALQRAQSVATTASRARTPDTASASRARTPDIASASRARTPDIASSAGTQGQAANRSVPGEAEADATQQRLQEHWRTLPDADKLATSWAPGELETFAKRVGFPHGHRSVGVTELPTPDMRGVALNGTQVALIPDGARQSQLRIAKLASNELVNGNPLTPGAVVNGQVGSRKQTSQINQTGQTSKTSLHLRHQ